VSHDAAIKPSYKTWTARHLLAWYDTHRRDLPWRRRRGQPPPDPYAVLVSEFMLQQTQVTTVIDYFHRWMNRFPSLSALAAADEAEILRAWQGLGYYSRARNLHRAARAVVADFAGQLPRTATDLRRLPGVGPYTAGAIASLAYDTPEPIVDGNVQRVLTRLFAYPHDPRATPGQHWTWSRAAGLVPRHRAGDFNSALMELGATVCRPANPDCNACPLRAKCLAHSQNLTHVIPPPKPTRATPLETRDVFCIRRRDRFLLERRPLKGRWAGLWQFPTRPAGSVICPALETLGEVRHQLTHRRYLFNIHLVRGASPLVPLEPHTWVRLGDLDQYALSKPQLKTAEILRKLGT
jgi:A/G-specific adenine glycosylase